MSELVVMVLGAAILLGLIMLSVTKSAKPQSQKLDKAMVQQKWSRIKQLASTSGESAKMAVIEADKLLDYVLKARNYSGETMGDRLKQAGSDFSYTDDVWEAHKLRNKLVHETEYDADDRLVKKSIRQFEQALKDMRVL